MSNLKSDIEDALDSIGMDSSIVSLVEDIEDSDIIHIIIKATYIKYDGEEI